LIRQARQWPFALFLVMVGCGKPLPGADPVPPGTERIPGVFEDVGPRWSHDGSRIAFLRRTTDRKYQLCIASAGLRTVTPLLKPELLSPDRPFRTSRAGYTSPDQIAWSPDDSQLIFPRVEWMTFPDGERLAGTALWRLDIRTRRATPLAVHPEEYKGSLYYYRSPSWSPDGKHIAFVGEGIRGESALIVIPSVGARVEIDNPRPDSFFDTGWPAWSPDGKRLAFRQGIRRGLTADIVETIRVIEPGGTYAARVWATTPERYDLLVGKQPLISAASSQGGPDVSAPRCSAISWSPDGTKLAFTIARDATDPLTSAIWTLDLRGEGGQPKAAPGIDPSNMDGFADPFWLDAGRLGAIQAVEGSDSDLRLNRLVIVDLWAGPAHNAATRIEDLPSTDLDWSPDRRQVVVAGPASKAGADSPITTLRLHTVPR
jgi:Tol biopolymer transport system component